MTVEAKTYFESRIIHELDITPEFNQITLKSNNPGLDHEVSHLKCDIFYPDQQDNICIRVFNLKREIIYYLDKKNDNPLSTQNKIRPFILKRLKHPKEYTENGKTKYKKYDIPKGAGTHPFITPIIITKFEKQEKIKTLILTEGYFKAFKGYMHGLDIIGLSSITHVKDKETEQMYRDVLDVIGTCKVENVIILYDGDCRNISLSALKNGEDLITRPMGFMASASKVAELLKDCNVSVYFAYIQSDSIETAPKGLDDLYISFKGREKEITEDLLSLSKPSRYFYKCDITASTIKLAKFFHCQDVNDFYKFHAEYIADKKFQFRGTQYQWNSSNNNCDIIVPKAVLEYFQVGDNYYKFVKVPNQYKRLETRIAGRKLATIQQLIGKNFAKHISYYEEFCNVPDHINYAQVIDNCFNLYSKFEHEPEEGDCDLILSFLKHIFQEQYELGLDYIQLLYQKPYQKLPILCLVSIENQTGKSTFIDLMQLIFTDNCITIGNDDLANQFNYSWAGKLLICCNETFIEKKGIVEKIKALCTQSVIVMNRKGKDHNKIDFFGKFILTSNNEEDFIYASKYDQRYWVIKVNKVDKRDPNLVKKMLQEIPAFLHFVNNRKLVTQNEDRMWFKPEIRMTQALKDLIEANKSNIESELTYSLREMFIQFGFKYILLSPDAIRRELFNNRYNTPYIARKIRKLFNVNIFRNYDGIPVTHRFYWPRWDRGENPEPDKSSVYIGRPYIFKLDDFLTKDEIKYVKISNQISNDFNDQDASSITFNENEPMF